MNIQGFQKLTLLDFPGKVACTIFTGGCNLRCPFCHNAGLVLEPHQSSNLESEVLEYLSKRRGLLDAVCITGGEPLLQPDLKEFIQKVHSMGYLIKFDTNGTLPDRLQDILSTNLISYVAMDIKSSPKNYRNSTGAEINVSDIEESIKVLKDSNIAHEFRTTAVKGLHTLEDFADIADWICGTERYYLQKFVDSGNLICSGEFSAFSDEETEEFLNVIRKKIPNVGLRG